MNSLCTQFFYDKTMNRFADIILYFPEGKKNTLRTLTFIISSGSIT